MYISFFNSFKERLVNGQVPDSFWVDCFPIKSSFFEKFNTDEYKVGNFRTLKDLETLGYQDTLFDYKQSEVKAVYGCEFLTEPYTTYRTQNINGVDYSMIETQRYTYLSARMNYRYEQIPDTLITKDASASIARGLVKYDWEQTRFLVHYFNHPAEGPNFYFAKDCTNDGTTLWMGYVPDKQAMVNNLCNMGQCPGIFPISGTDFGGFLFADTSGNLIKVINFENPTDFNGNSFVYQYPNVTTVINKEDGSKANWATFVDLA